MWNNRDSHGRVACGIKTMVFTIAVLVAAGGVLVLYFARAAGRVNPANLGWMSAQWLAEHRASHLS
jgi:hypothetical protein